MKNFKPNKSLTFAIFFSTIMPMICIVLTIIDLSFFNTNIENCLKLYFFSFIFVIIICSIVSFFDFLFSLRRKPNVIIYKDGLEAEGYYVDYNKITKITFDSGEPAGKMFKGSPSVLCFYDNNDELLTGYDFPSIRSIIAIRKRCPNAKFKIVVNKSTIFAYAIAVIVISIIYIFDKNT